MQRNDGGETVEEGTVYLLVSSCLVDDQLVDQLVQFEGISVTKLVGPTFEFISILVVIAVSAKNLFIYVGSHALAFGCQWACGSLEDALEEDHPSLKSSKISDVLWRGNMKSRVEALKDLIQKEAGGLVEIAQNLFNNLLEFGKDQDDKLLKLFSFVLLDILVNLGHLSAKVDTCLNSAVEIIQDLFGERGPNAKVGSDDEVDDFFVYFDGVRIVFDLVEEVNGTVSEY